MDPARFPDALHGPRFGGGIRQEPSMGRRTFLALAQDPRADDQAVAADSSPAWRGRAATRALGMRPRFVEARGPENFDRAFSDMTRARAGALTVLSTPMFASERSRLVALAPRTGCRQCTH